MLPVRVGCGFEFKISGETSVDGAGTVPARSWRSQHQPDSL